VREQVFLSWAGLRGAIPIILATIPMSDGIARAPFLFDVVLVFVVVSTLIQAPTLPRVARRLRVVNEDDTRDVEVEAAPLDKISADLLQVRIPTGSRLNGVEIGELRLPQHTVVSLVIRDEAAFSPAPRDRIKIGDELLIVTPTAQRLLTEERLRSIGKRGRLAGWRDASR
ncbi:MAG TPA: TrkA C-terminal domain-containing protein, partial [Propionibacteriaceae bacterium]